MTPRCHGAAALEGAIAGAFATLPMSAATRAFQRAGGLGEPPPRTIVREALARAGAPRSRRGVEAAAWVAHLGFGASVGALYGLADPWPGVGRATLAALGVWAASYAGWVPALGLLPPATRDRPGRPAAMIAAHVVFGVALGVALRARRGSSPAAGAATGTSPRSTGRGVLRADARSVPPRSAEVRHGAGVTGPGLLPRGPRAEEER